MFLMQKKVGTIYRDGLLAFRSSRWHWESPSKRKRINLCMSSDIFPSSYKAIICKDSTLMAESYPNKPKMPWIQTLLSFSFHSLDTELWKLNYNTWSQRKHLMYVNIWDRKWAIVLIYYVKSCCLKDNH